MCWIAFFQIPNIHHIPRVFKNTSDQIHAKTNESHTKPCDAGDDNQLPSPKSFHIAPAVPKINLF